MKVLAIDPGYGRCGMAVVEKTSNGEILLFSDCVETSAADSFPDRLGAIVAKSIQLADMYRPDAFAIEKLYFSTNQKTAMRVAEVRGALIEAAVERDIPVFEYGPGQVKSAVAGSGNADKQQVSRMVRLLVKIEKKVRHDDEYDAIAIGITHCALVRTHALAH